MNRIVPIVALTLALAAGLVGCAPVAVPAPSATPTPTPTVNAAEKPCNDFSDLTDETATLIVNIWTDKDGDGDAKRLSEIPDDFDMLALKTEGPIGDRIQSVSELLHDTAPIIMSTNPDDYFDAIKAVQRACAAEGVDISVATWS